MGSLSSEVRVAFGGVAGLLFVVVGSGLELGSLVLVIHGDLQELQGHLLGDKRVLSVDLVLLDQGLVFEIPCVGHLYLLVSISFTLALLSLDLEELHYFRDAVVVTVLF